MAEPEMVFVGVKPCGCTVAAVVDSETVPERDKAENVLGWLRDDLTVARMPLDQARASLSICECAEGSAA